DNQCWHVEPGKSTNPNQDCDGFYVPADRKIKQVAMGTIEGPCAVKIPPEINAVITQEGNTYAIDIPNTGVFKVNDFCRPSNYPKCVNWYIPNMIYNEVFK